MKKLKILALSVAFALTGCGGGDSSGDSSNGGNSGGTSKPTEPSEPIYELVERVSAQELPEMVKSTYMIEDGGAYVPLTSERGDHCVGEFYAYKAGKVIDTCWGGDEVPSFTADDAATTLKAVDRALNELYVPLGYESATDMIHIFRREHLRSSRIIVGLIANDLYLDGSGIEPTFISIDEVNAINATLSTLPSCLNEQIRGEDYIGCMASNYYDSLEHETIDGSVKQAKFAKAAVDLFTTDFALIDSTLKSNQPDGDYAKYANFNEDKIREELHRLKVDYVDGGVSLEVRPSSSINGAVSSASSMDNYITLPETMYTQDFYYPIIKHESIHALTNALNNHYRFTTSWYVEGVAVFYAQQALDSWAELSEVPQEAFDSWANGDNVSVDRSFYPIYGAMFQYLTIATTEEDAVLKNEKLLTWIKGANVGSDPESADDKVRRLFNEQKFTDHKGGILTYTSFHRDIKALALKLSQEENVGSYKSYGHDDYGRK